MVICRCELNDGTMENKPVMNVAQPRGFKSIKLRWSETTFKFATYGSRYKTMVVHETVLQLRVTKHCGQISESLEKLFFFYFQIVYIRLILPGEYCYTQLQ
ncbi:hypothetical protein C0J52_11964 [Blattella germanica]|nr:hypothetical protein C0J52_11964 [Blattella germanica]